MGHVFRGADPCFSCGQLTCLEKGSPTFGPGKYCVGAQSTVAHKRISPPHKDSGPLLSLARPTKEVTFVCLGGRRGCVTTVQAGERGGGRGGTGGPTMTEGLDEVKTQGWPSLFVTASSFTEHRCSSPMVRFGVYLLHGFPPFTQEPLMAPSARPSQASDSAIHLLLDQWTLQKTD